METKLHHIGMGVTDLNSALQILQTALRLESSEIVDLSGSKAALIPVGDTLLELIEPCDSPVNTASESLYRLVKERGGGVHHLAFEVEDIELVIEQLRRGGLRLTQEGLREGKGGKFAWLEESAMNGLMIEICDKGYQVK